MLYSSKFPNERIENKLTRLAPFKPIFSCANMTSKGIFINVRKAKNQEKLSVVIRKRFAPNPSPFANGLIAVYSFLPFNH